jgi:transposase
MEAPPGFSCPYKHQCPHLEWNSTTWVMMVFHEHQRPAQSYYALTERHNQQIADMQKTIDEKDAQIAQLRLEHQKNFKPSKTVPLPQQSHQAPPRRGAPVGHPPWRRKEPDHVDAVVQMPAPKVCPHCQCEFLREYPGIHKHLQEDIVLIPRTHVTRFEHRQSFCPHCRRAVHQSAPEEMPGCHIGPVTRAVATHLRYDLQIPYRKVQYILAHLFGMPFVPASAMAFDRKATARGRPLYEELRVKLQHSKVAYADETHWRQDADNHYVWYGGNESLAVYGITDNRSADSAVQLLGHEFDGALVTDGYTAYNAVNARHRQTCWSHIHRRCRELLEQIQLTDPPIQVPLAVGFCRKLQKFSSHLCDLGRQLRQGTLRLSAARRLIPKLEKRLARFAGQALDYPPAETLRQRIMQKDHDKLFTFLRIKGMEPTNNHAERSIRPLVIMRKICFGTRSVAGSESHGVLPSILQTARRQGKDPLKVLTAILTKPTAGARAALFSDSS